MVKGGVNIGQTDKYLLTDWEDLNFAIPARNWEFFYLLHIKKAASSEAAGGGVTFQNRLFYNQLFCMSEVCSSQFQHIRAPG